MYSPRECPAKKLELFKKQAASATAQDLLNTSENINGMQFIAQEVSLDSSEMKQLCFQLKSTEKNLIVVLGGQEEERAIISIFITDDLVAKGINANEMIKEVSKTIKGGGGGQPFFATAGGSEISAIPEALSIVKQLISK